jgi:hypothetical protein
MSEKYRITAFFNGVNTFKSAFPEVQDAVVEWREKRGPDDEKGLDLRKTGFRRGNFTQGVVPCSNPVCHEGGYQLDRLVSAMLAEGETQREGVMLCSGREVAEEVRRGPVRCSYRIAYRATLQVRTEKESRREGRPEGNRRPQYRRGRGRGGGQRRSSPNPNPA